MIAVTRSTEFRPVEGGEEIRVSWEWERGGRVLVTPPNTPQGAQIADEARAEAAIAQMLGGIHVYDLDFRIGHQIDAAGRRLTCLDAAGARVDPGPLTGVNLLIAVFQADLQSIRPVRASAGEIARRLGVSRQVVSGVLAGRTRLSADGMAAWARKWAAQGEAYTVVDILLPGDAEEARVVVRQRAA